MTTFKEFLVAQKDKIAFFAVDEAHTIDTWSGFRPSMQLIGETRKLVPQAKWVGVFH